MFIYYLILKLMLVNVLYKCPRCGQEVEYFLRRKPKDPYLFCPKCNEQFYKRELQLPPDAKIEIRYMETVGEEEEEKEEKPQTKPKKPLFEVPKEPAQIISEILTDWGCDEDFVKRVADYVNMKGYFDPAWLMNMLLHARTGRKFTDQEAYMVVDIITSALEQEKRRTEEAGKVFPLSIISLRGTSTTPPYYPLYTPPSYPTYQPPPQYTYVPPQYTPQAPATPSTSTVAPYVTTYSQPPITPQQIQEMIRQAMAEYKKQSDLDELKRMMAELEKKRIEDRAELEKMIAKAHEEMTKTVASIQTQPIQAQPQPTIDKKDIELMRLEFEKALTQKLSELEKKYIESKSEAEKKELQNQIASLKEQIEAVRREATSRPISPEGWQKDETRLVAELGTRFFDIIKERKPIEYLIRIIPQQPPQQQQKTEKSLVEMIKESGGVVE